MGIEVSQQRAGMPTIPNRSRGGNADDPDIGHDGGDGGKNDMPGDAQLSHFALLLKLGDACLQRE